jgi:hypothetical protein
MLVAVNREKGYEILRRYWNAGDIQRRVTKF